MSTFFGELLRFRPHHPVELARIHADIYGHRMRKHDRVSRLLEEAEREHRCAIGGINDSLYYALRRRVDSLELVCPYPNLYASSQYWNSLTLDERQHHVVGALMLRHPKWTFAGLTAACIYGFQHSYSLHDGTVHIASTGAVTGRDHKRLHRIYMSGIPQWQCRGIPVTSPARTLVDCASLPFSHALAIYDSALRMRRVTDGDIRTIALTSGCDEDPVLRLLRYADPGSENGGESVTRGRIIECGFAVPSLQVEFDNPNNPDMRYRVDYCWRLYNGRIIAAEYDGMAKYADVSNMNRASLQAKLDYERRRERHLKEQHVSVVHLFYEDVMNPERLTAKLMDAGVPMIQ